MFGIENSANNFGASAGLLANTLANIPAQAALGTLYITTDTLEIYRYNGTTWLRVGSGNGLIGAYNGLGATYIGNDLYVGLGGSLSENTQIDITDFPLEFYNNTTTTANFRIVGNTGLGEYAYVTSIASTNDGGVYFGNFETSGTIQSKSFLLQIPTLLYLNKTGGDVVIGSTTNFSVNQTAAAFVFTNGSILIPNGTFSIPTIAFTSDTNTGFYRSAANSIGVSCGGTRQLTISANGLRNSTTIADGSTSGSFKVGLYTAGIIVSTGTIKLEINGVVYRLLTST